MRDKDIKIRSEEIELIRVLAARLSIRDKSSETMNGWFYSFTIPQIGKEFDLLKIGRNGVVVNVELKSQPVSEEKIKNQLEQNKYYLSHMSNTIYNCTLVKETEKNS